MNNIDFLNYIYQNSKMGMIGINDIAKDIKNKELRKIIKEQYNDYKDICNRSVEIFKKYGKEEKEINMLAKISTYISSKINLIGKDHDKEIAKMMIKGSNTGIIEITEKLNYYENSDPNIKYLAKLLLKVEERNLEQLKPYL